MKSRNNYLVAVFTPEGKNAGLYYSEDLSELPVIRATHRNCEIQISDMRDVFFMPDDMVKDIEQSKEKEYTARAWSFRVRKLETGEVFGSIRECALSEGIPYKKLYNALRTGAYINGVHYIYDKEKL